MKQYVLFTVFIVLIMTSGCAKKIEEPTLDTAAAESSEDDQETRTDETLDLNGNEYDQSNDELAYLSIDQETNENGDEEEDSLSDMYLSTSSYHKAQSSSSHSRLSSNCTGSDTYYTCYDPQNGNNYQVSKYGSTTQVQGSNLNTGSTWSQTTNHYGDMSQTTGYDKNGNTWNQTTNHYGDDSYSYSGTNSEGESFGGTCNYGSCSTY